MGEGDDRLAVTRVGDGSRMKTSASQLVATTTMEVECPWCAGDASIEVVRAGSREAATFTCPICSVDVAMAPEPVGRLVATAA